MERPDNELLISVRLVLHLKEGDSNTRFFHRMTNSNRRNNGIENLMVNGSLSSNQDMIADCIT